MKILVIGSEGQLGSELKKTCPGDCVLTAVDYPDIDLCDAASVTTCIGDASYDVVINAAAYTAVDLAETEPDKARKVNSEGVRAVATAVKNTGARLVHISTDFVFDGEKGSPYLPEDKPNPQSVYGQTKLDGEKAVIDILGENALIIRTAWLYSATGSNFVKTMLRLMAERESLSVVDDQIGSPCWALGLATAIWRAIEKKCTGVFHWTDAGVASWYDFALAIQEEGLAKGLISKEIPVTPIASKEYPTPAKRPPYSVLDKSTFLNILEIKPVHWRIQLRSMLNELKTVTGK